jgi:hypothetical protein
MARGSASANTAATSAQNISNTAAGNASSLFGTLAPELMSEAANPSGFDPATMAKMDTEALQSAGGANAGAAGQAGLRAARTRNIGGGDAAIAASGRNASEIASRGVLGNQIKNAELKESQRRAATSGLEGLFNNQSGTSVNALGQVAGNVNANTNAENASWDWMRYGLDPFIQAAGGASPTIAKAFG